MHTEGPLFKLRFAIAEIDHWAGRYQYDGDAVVEQEIGPAAKQAGFLTKEQFLKLCRWKSPRTAPRCAANSADHVKEVTRVALSQEQRLKETFLDN